jgi:hypothetical protein
MAKRKVAGSNPAVPADKGIEQSSASGAASILAVPDAGPAQHTGSRRVGAIGVDIRGES